MELRPTAAVAVAPRRAFHCWNQTRDAPASPPFGATVGFRVKPPPGPAGFLPASGSVRLRALSFVARSDPLSRKMFKDFWKKFLCLVSRFSLVPQTQFSAAQIHSIGQHGQGFRSQAELGRAGHGTHHGGHLGRAGSANPAAAPVFHFFRNPALPLPLAVRLEVAPGEFVPAP